MQDRMKFRTEIDIKPFPFGIDYASRGFMMGSCFADSMALRLRSHKFRVMCNPCGVMYNPLSVVSAFRMIASGREFSTSDLLHYDRRFMSLDFHGSFSDTDSSRAVDKMNRACRLGCQALAEADYVMITLGTSWIYEYEGRAVANCHKLPASEFTRRRLSVRETVEALSSLMDNELSGKNVVFTVSPIRHLKDGFEGNSLSKALLRVAVEEVVCKYASAYYFPSYEILYDDLRDYRFYDSDLCHPSVAAADYIWEKFCDAFISADTKNIMAQVDKVVSAASHRPFDKASSDYAAFCSKFISQAQKISEMYPHIDLSDEIAALSV